MAQSNSSLQDFIDQQVDALFVLVHNFADSVSADITPEQTMRLDRIKTSLSTLVLEQVNQNLETTDENQEKSCVWEVPVTRIGFAHKTIRVLSKEPITETEAIETALDEAGDEFFSENSSEYEANDGAIKID